MFAAPITQNSPDTRTSITSPSQGRLAQYLDPDTASAGTSSVQRISQNDPIILGMLSLAEAASLIQHFHQYLNIHVAVLDPDLHTLEYLRLTSVPLLAAILSCAARIFHPALHASLFSHARTVIDRSMLSGAEDTGLVQAILIWIFYQPPSEPSTWKRIGWAIRMGYESRWHLTRKRPLPASDFARRLALNDERTWICLYCFDFSYSKLFDLPMTIRPHEVGDVEGWSREHFNMNNPIDLHLACAHDGIKIRQPWRLFLSSKSVSEDYRSLLIADTTSRCQAFLAKWYDPAHPYPGFDQTRELRGKWTCLETLLSVQKVALEASPTDLVTIQECLRLAGEIVAQTEVTETSGQLRTMQDLVMVQSTMLARFLTEIIWQLNHTQRKFVISLVKRLYACYSRIPAESDTAPAIVGRALRRILESLGESQHGTRQGSPAIPLEPDLSADLAEFFAFTDPMPPNPADDLYWSGLFQTMMDGVSQ